MSNFDKKQYQKEWRAKNKARKSELAKKYAEQNKDRLKAYKAAYYQNNKEKIREQQSEYQKNNRSEINTKRFQRKATDPSFRAICNARDRVRQFVKGKNISSGKIGCSFKQFVEHIESMFSENMNWENYGKTWEIDHIYPLSVASKKGMDDLKKACHYSNLRPRRISENRSDGGRLV